MTPVELRFKRAVRAPVDVVWRAMSNTDAFNRIAGLGFEFGQEERSDGSVRRVGRVRRFGQTLEWEERPFQFREPGALRSVRVFRAGPVETVTADFALVETEGGTGIDYRVRLQPRYAIARPLIALDARMNTAPPLERALDAVVEAVESDSPRFDPPPVLADDASETLARRLAAVSDPTLAETLQRLIATAPLVTQCRIQPARIAEQLERPLDDVLEACMQAVGAGVLETRFLLLCPICLGAKVELTRLDFSRRAIHCDSCNVGYDGALIDNVEVAFRPVADIRTFAVPVDCIQSPARTPHVVFQEIVPTGEVVVADLLLGPGCHRLDARPVRGALHLEVVDDGPSEVVVDITEKGAFPRRVEVGRGEVRLLVRSRVDSEVVVSVAKRWRPPQVLTVARFLAHGSAGAWASDQAGITGQMGDGYAIVVAVPAPWSRADGSPVPDVEAELHALGIARTQVANGLVLGVVDALPRALEVVEAISAADRAVALAGGAVVTLTGEDGSTVVGEAIDRVLTVLRGVGWGRTAVEPTLSQDPSFAQALARFQGRIQLVEGWSVRPPLLRFSPLATEVPTHPEEPLDDDTIPGFVGPFRVQEKLGRGGMGSVYRAVHERTREVVVLKALHARYARDFKYAAAFYREARLGWAVRHPRVCRVLDWGIDPARRVLFLTMEPVAGETLRDRVRRDGPLRGDALRSLALELLEALSAIHDAGVVHRDLKPTNVMCTRRGAVIIDFGVALPMDGERSRVAGTVAFMSPEQSRGRVLDERSDLYQLAVLLVRVGTARWPFEGRAPLDRLRWRDAHPVESLPPGIPDDLVPVLLRALKVDPAERYPTARAMRAAIR
jgi:predicted Ser/Thr protein kinase